jgi:pyridoxal phosphate enzyme (YggS family)
MRKKLEAIKERCRIACEKAGRAPDSVRILAVSKGHGIDAILEAYSLGVRDFGENYAAEMAQKIEALQTQCPEIRWHYIGHIQSNKLRLITGASWIHSLSEITHAQGLSAFKTNPHVLLQVNLGGEEKRSGVLEKDLLERYLAIRALPHFHLCGLMTIAPQHVGVATGVWFKKMQELRSGLEQKIGQALPELSMGMSADFEEAIQFGATWVRVGTLLFGEREVLAKR